MRPRMHGGWLGGRPRAGGSRRGKAPGPCWRRLARGRRASTCFAFSAGPPGRLLPPPRLCAHGSTADLRPLWRPPGMGPPPPCCR
eukprot:14112652-Alexandrium_andersonii.AAC.1